MPKPVPSHHLLYLMLRAQQLAKQESNDGGYVMVVVSILTVMIFSLLAAYLMMTNISKSATNAYMEGNSSFYAAESGLNQRANAIRQKFIDYSTPDGLSPGAVPGQLASVANMAACVDASVTNDGDGDYTCQKLELNYRQGLGSKFSTGTDGGSLLATDYNSSVKYTAYTFASDRTIYTNPVLRIPQVTTVPAGQAFAGLNAQEYRYTVYSMATSKQPQDIDAKATTVLEMTFKSRAIPLFQFAAFYDGDLEMNSTSQMDVTGRLHTNGNLYIQPTPLTTETTRLLSPVTVAGQIYNRVDASIVPRFGTTLVLMTGDPTNPNAATNTYLPFPSYDPARTTALTPAEITPFQGKVMDGAAGVSKLKLPQPGFLRKRDNDNNIGEYYGKADLRLEMFPKRAAGNVPFNFAAIKNGGVGGSCSGFDIPTGRQGASLNCVQLNEGQLRSLQQPVMVKVLSDEERTRFCPGLTKNYNPSSGGSAKKLRALQVAIASQNTTVSLAQLNLPLSNPTNATIESISEGLQSSVKNDSPVDIAAKEGACFLPAPIQVLAGSGTVNSNYNWQSSYFDRRENRWIGILQTNITSLTLWNRDGLYVDRDDDLTTNDAPASGSSQVNSAFNSGDPSATYDTNNLLFIRAAAKPTAPTGSFQKLGLGAADPSEGGLVYHATVSDDIDDDGTIDITIDPVDKLRNYPDGKKKSSYGFAVSGGSDLPGALTVVTDRALYVQGDYNNFATNAGKQPAALVGDTITVLSNSCLDADLKINCGILAGQNIATATTVNAAFLSSTDASSGNAGTATFGTSQSYSGGLNNYMRMVEDWSGQNFNYTGSFVSLGTPQEFSGVYVPGGVAGYYDVPNRNFSYETNFNAFNLLPPMTPKVLYLQQETFKRSYN